VRLLRFTGKSTTAVLIGIVLAAFAWSGLTVSAETLRVGSEVDYPPFEYFDETGTAVGFDIDIVHAIGRIMGVEIEIVNAPWGEIIPRLIRDEYDLIASAMTITQERAKLVDFSEPYFTNGQIVVVRTGESGIQSAADLRDKNVAVKAGTTSVDAALELDVANILTFAQVEEAYHSLLAGEVDAVIHDQFFVPTDPEPFAGRIRTVGEPFTLEYYGFAVKKGRTDLLQGINDALAAIKADGTYERIHTKWFGIEPSY